MARDESSRLIFRHLRYFSATADHGTVVAAANALRVAQPALSRQLRALERAVGRPLLERSARGVRVTRAGCTLLEGTRTVAAQLSAAVRSARLAHEGKLGTLRLGLGRAALERKDVGIALSSLRERLPDVDLEVTEFASSSGDERLLADAIDLAIDLRSPSGQSTGIRREVLFAQVIDSVLLSASHALAHYQHFEPALLHDQPLIMLSATAADYAGELFDALRRLHDGPLDIHDTAESVYSVVAAGQGWTPSASDTLSNPPAGTVVRPLAGLHVPLTIALSRRSTDRSRLVANAVGALRAATAGKPVHGLSRPTRGPTTMTGSICDLPRGLELRHLRALTAMMAEGTVDRAAARLKLTQSGLSRQLRALEVELGVQLFRRTRAGLVANAAASAFQREAAVALTTLERALLDARGTSQQRARTYRIGALPAELRGDVVSRVIREMNERHPTVSMEVTEVLTPRQVDALLTGEIDVGIAAAYPGVVNDPGIVSLQIESDVVDCAMLAAAHPLARRASLMPADLADIPFLFIPRIVYPQLYDAVMQAFARRGVVPRIDGTFDGPRAVWRFAADGLGWTIGTRRLRANPPPGVVGVPIAGLHIPSGVQVLWRRDEQDGQLLALLDTFALRRSAYR